MTTKDRVIQRINARIAVHPLAKQIGENYDDPGIHALIEEVLAHVEDEVNNLKQMIEFKVRQATSARVCSKCGGQCE